MSFTKEELQKITNYTLNVVSIYHQATDTEFNAGTKWYIEAHEIARDWAKQYNVPVYKIVGVISAYSINNGWNQNINWAKEFILSQFGKGVAKGLQLQKDYAQKVWSSNSLTECRNIFLDEEKRTYKLYCFFENIYSATKETNISVNVNKSTSMCLPVVTMDRHAISACLDEPTTTIKRSLSKAKNYVYFAEAYQIAANKFGLLPQQFQAVVWLAVRRLKGVSLHHG